jgi:hypothetical protein
MAILLLSKIRAYFAGLIQSRCYMESKIPLPTDNIYKFAALFSLVVLVVSFCSIIYSNSAANAIVFEHWVEVENLQSQEKLTVEQSSRLKALEKKIEVAVSDKQLFIRLASVFLGLGICGVLFGFGYWHKRIQPLADQMALTQLEMARLQLLLLSAEVKAKGLEAESPKVS